MNKLARYIIIAVVTAAVLLVVWYFQHIVAYVLIAAVLSLIGKPLMGLLARIRYKKWRLPTTIRAALTLLSIWLTFVLFFYIFTPLIIGQLDEFSRVDVGGVIGMLDKPMHDIDMLARKYISSDPDFSVKATLAHELEKVVDVTQISLFFGSLAATIKNFAIAIFAISFITFFFLKEDKLFYQTIVYLFPQRYEANIKRALSSTHRLLVRYFIGIFSDILCVMTLLTLGLTFVAGFSWRQALFIGLLAGVLNMIPYVGQLISYALGTAICLATASNADVTFLPFLLKMLAVLFSVQIIDASVLQPFIYSNSVKAHPLEIFLVILTAGSLGGILGMLVAIPTYTVLRVFAKEFFNNFRVVRKLTEKI
ncbi:MAG: AI-2E family transporter [Prevotellaceae bacterium]|jgi:predicted PurR-regulated permease PerM|nr:AI-2E family transporter [Prevotellaceae bacterium]